MRSVLYFAVAFHLVVFQYEIVSRRKPNTLPDTPLTLQYVQAIAEDTDEMIDERLETHIDVHFNFDVGYETDLYWNKTLQRTWFDSWSENMKKTNIYLKADQAGREKLVKATQDIDTRIENLKDKVRVFVHSDPEVPRMTYCVVPVGYKVGKYSEWITLIDLEEDIIPDQFFYVNFMEYLWSDWTKVYQEDQYINQMNRRDTDFAYGEYKRAAYYGVRWVQDQEDTLEYLRVDFRNSRLQYRKYDPVTFEPQTLTIPLEVTGFEPKPAIAWDRPPRMPENPLNHKVLRKDKKSF